MASNSPATPVRPHKSPSNGGMGARNLFAPPLTRGGGSKPTRKMGDGRFENAKNPLFFNPA